MEEKKESPHSIKVLLFGDEASKKSDLLNTIKDNCGGPQYNINTSENRIILTIPLRADCSVRVDIRNHKQDLTHSSSPLLGIQLVLLVFSYADVSTFNNLDDWLTEIERYTRNNITTVIIGNCFSDTNQGVTEIQAKTFTEEHSYILAKVREGDFESILNALILALNEVPTLKPQPAPVLPSNTEEQVTESESHPCCQCTMF